MSEQKYTPGPWHVAEHDHGIVVCTDSTKKSQYGASRYTAIGGFDRKDHEQLAEALANARLISAAPELLSAALAARDVLATAIRANWEGATDDDISNHATIKRIDNAISKATGA